MLDLFIFWPDNAYGSTSFSKLNMILLPSRYSQFTLLGPTLGLDIVLSVSVELLLNGAARWSRSIQERWHDRLWSEWKSESSLLLAVVFAEETLPQRESSLPSPVRLPFLCRMHSERHRLLPVHWLLLKGTRSQLYKIRLLLDPEVL